MKVLVISDSHRRRSTMEAVCELCARPGAPDMIVHLGDYISDARYVRQRVKQRVIAVPGNCDWGDEGPEEIIERLGGADVLICHGHTLRVKQSLLSLVCRAREAEVRAALFGHTHAPLMEFEEGILLLNPGALQDGRYALLDITGGEIRAGLKTLDGMC